MNSTLIRIGWHLLDTNSTLIANRKWPIGFQHLVKENLCFDYEENYAQENEDLEAIVYMAAGAEEHILGPYHETINPGSYKIFKDAKTAEYTQGMIDKLESRQYPNLKLTGRLLEEETHFTIMGALIAKGLRQVVN